MESSINRLINTLNRTNEVQQYEREQFKRFNRNKYNGNVSKKNASLGTMSDETRRVEFVRDVTEGKNQNTMPKNY